MVDDDGGGDIDAAVVVVVVDDDDDDGPMMILGSPSHARTSQGVVRVRPLRSRLRLFHLAPCGDGLRLKAFQTLKRRWQQPAVAVAMIALEARILVMQPRRIAATTLAERIAAERCQALGEDVGYQVPFGSRAENARLVFCTLGVFRRRLLNDPDLLGVTHIIFDEVHERDKLADFNMIPGSNKASDHDRPLRLEATLQMDTFERYFQGAFKIRIPGRVFPVSELYLDEVAATLWKQPMFRQWLGPGILCGGIDALIRKSEGFHKG
eukprot:s426_g4.t1